MKMLGLFLIIAMILCSSGYERLFDSRFNWHSFYGNYMSINLFDCVIMVHEDYEELHN